MKKNYSTSLILTIAVLIVLVGTATYAFFAANVDTNNVAYINTTTPGGVATFSTNGDEAVIDITAAQMAVAASDNSTAIATNTVNITANLVGVSTSSVYCTYDVNLTWDGTVYAKTEGVGSGKEFTYSVESACTMDDNSTCDASTVLPTQATETQIPDLATNQSIKIGTGKIYTASDSVTTSINTAVTLNFYNIEGLDQTEAQASKVYNAKIFVTNVKC